MYKILESRIEFREDKLHKVTVLVDCTCTYSKPFTDVRAFSARTKPENGYMWLCSSRSISAELLQEVAGGGRTEPDRDKIFPKWKSNLKSK